MENIGYDAERLDVEYKTNNLFIALMKEEGIYRYALARRILEGRSAATPSVLDAACGYGYGSPVLGGGIRYLGIDVSDIAVSRARAAYPGAEFRVGDLLMDATYSDLPRFDAVLSFETIEHVAAPTTFLAHCRRALKDDTGILMLSAPTTLTRDWTPFHLHDRSANGWRRTIQNAGFHVFGEVSQGFTIPFQTFALVRPSNKSHAAKPIAALFDLIRGNQDVARFLATHPRYLVHRAYDWLWRGRFRWESRLYLCEPDKGNRA